MVVLNLFYVLFTAAGLAQSVERLTAQRGVAGSILWAGAVLGVFKNLIDEGTSFAPQAARSPRSSDDHVKWRVPSPVGNVKIVYPISAFLQHTLALLK